MGILLPLCSFYVHGQMGLLLSDSFFTAFAYFLPCSVLILSAAFLIPRFSDVHWTLAVPSPYSTQVPCSSIVRNRPSCLLKAPISLL
jgi:hypothetical protein